jgi:predicted house-cleaning NTP pyrophosphatase (Maf/HAM1 superfamily)
MKRILLASGSPRRKELLTQMGCVFEVCKSEAEEVITSTNPEEVVMELSSQRGRIFKNNRRCLRYWSGHRSCCGWKHSWKTGR